MIEAYEIGIKLGAVDRLSPSLDNVIAKLQTANAEILKMTANLRDLSLSSRLSFSSVAAGGVGGVGAAPVRVRKSDDDPWHQRAYGFGAGLISRGMAEAVGAFAAGDLAYHSIKMGTEYSYLLSSIQAARNATADQMKLVNETLQRTSMDFGVSMVENAKNFQRIITGSALTIPQLTTAYPALMGFGRAFSLLKPGESPAEGVHLAMKIAHATGNYAPQYLRRVTQDVLGFAATTDATPSQIETALSYSIKPTIMAGARISEYLALMSTLSRQGKLRSLGGRDYADFFINMMRPMSPKAFGALQQLGFYSGNMRAPISHIEQTTGPRKGDLSLDKMFTLFQQDKDKFTRRQLMNLEYTAFGRQAGLIATTITSKNFMDQYRLSLDAAKKIKPIQQIVSDNNKTLLQQMRLTSTYMTAIMTDVGNDLQPTLFRLFRGLNKNILGPIAKGHFWSHTAHHVVKTWKGIGSDLGHFFSFSGTDRSSAAVAQMEAAQRRQQFQNMKNKGPDINVHIDGKLVAKYIAKHQGDGLVGELAGPSSYNIYNNYTPAVGLL